MTHTSPGCGSETCVQFEKVSVVPSLVPSCPVKQYETKPEQSKPAEVVPPQA